MNKWFIRLASLLIIAFLLAACSSDGNNENKTTSSNNTVDETEENEDSITITISEDEGEEIITEEEINIKEGAILMDVMEENFDIETDFNGAFITSIEGVAPENDDKAWLSFVNDEMTMVGAKEFELSPGDKVTWDLQAWE